MQLGWRPPRRPQALSVLHTPPEAAGEEKGPPAPCGHSQSGAPGTAAASSDRSWEGLKHACTSPSPSFSLAASLARFVSVGVSLCLCLCVSAPSPFPLSGSASRSSQPVSGTLTSFPPAPLPFSLLSPPRFFSLSKEPQPREVSGRWDLVTQRPGSQKPGSVEATAPGAAAVTTHPFISPIELPRF